MFRMQVALVLVDVSLILVAVHAIAVQIFAVGLGLRAVIAELLVVPRELVLRDLCRMMGNKTQQALQSFAKGYPGRKLA